MNTLYIGYANNYNELLILIRQFDPKIIFIQETHLTPFQNIPVPVNFEIYHTLSIVAKGGVALLIQTSLQHTQIPTWRIFDAIALEVHSAPNQKFTQSDLETMFPINNTQILITGDFKCWNSLWGSPKKIHTQQQLYLHT